MSENAEAAKALFFKGLDCLDAEDFAGAEKHLLETLALVPDHIASLNNLAVAQYRQGKLDDAIASGRKILALDPDNIDAHFSLLKCYTDQRDFAAALVISGKMTSLDPQSESAYTNHGHNLSELGRYSEALVSYDKALALKPDMEGAWTGRANVYTSLKQFENALGAYEKAFAIQPGLMATEGGYVFIKRFLCDWRDSEGERDLFVASVRKGIQKAAPFALLAVSDSPEDHLMLARAWAAKIDAAAGKRFWDGEKYTHDKIRVAYLSADFRNHAVSYLLSGVIEQHDRQRFEITAISFGADDAGPMRRRLKQSFDQFIDVNQMSDAAIAQLMRAREIDIAVDLMGFTAHARLSIFAHRPAPVQVNYLGYPGTSGAPYIDYLIADRMLVPETSRHFYTEKIAALPDSYLPHDGASRAISDRVFDRAEFGLPPHGFVFCCFNNAFKITPDVFATWMNILKAVDRSALWLSDMNPIAKGNLKQQAAAHGIDPARIVFAQRMPLSADHLARHRLADLFLDTLPYNAHTTASDALWAGLPVLTLIGESFPARVAASLLNAIDMPELIVHSREAYERTAVELARDPQKLAAIRGKLQRNRHTTSLFDTAQFTRHLESAFAHMHERHQKGLPPDHFDVLR